jgi:hypothetical protein
LFRDHHLSDVIGFVYSRIEAKSAAADLHGRLRHLGETVQSAQPLTICLFLDGENAWEYYPGNGREFLREFYGRIQGDQDFRALTASEAVAAAGEIPTINGIFPASWINANFDVWIGHSEDVAAWELLWDAREAYGRAVDARKQGRSDAPTETALKEALESLLVSEGSDWCWWYGPEHSTANDAEFDALYRKHLTGVYLALGQVAPEELAKPIKRRPEHALQLAPTTPLIVKVDGRDTSYFEWLGAGTLEVQEVAGAMHRTDRRPMLVALVHFGFDHDRLFVRIDTHERALDLLAGGIEVSLTFVTPADIRLSVREEAGRLTGTFRVHPPTGPHRVERGPDSATVAAGTVLELAVTLADLGIQPGQAVAFFVAVRDAQGLEIERHPAHGPIALTAPDALFVARNWRA